MAGNSQPLVLDKNLKPAPQYFNPTADAYEYLHGKNGAARSDPGVYITGSIAVGRKTVGTSQVQLCAGSSPLANRRGMKVRCEGNDAIYIGPNGVTVDTGYPVVPGEAVVLRFDPGALTDVYAIASSNQAARILEWS